MPGSDALMMRLRDGSIDFDLYRRRAASLRAEARRAVMRSAASLLARLVLALAARAARLIAARPHSTPAGLHALTHRADRRRRTG